MRDYSTEFQKRTEYIRSFLEKSGAKGIAIANSGGKDCALVGILCKKATNDVISVAMPCQSKRNYESDLSDAYSLAEQFGIETITVDLTEVKNVFCEQIAKSTKIIKEADVNIAPRLRMTAIYAIAQSKGYIVAGTGNQSEITMGYFTKWGDGAYDFNPISDLTVTEVYEFLTFLKAPDSIIKKSPSAGLYEGQTDELDMGVSYAELDAYILNGQGLSEESEKIIRTANSRTAHKRRMPSTFVNP